MRQTPRMAKDTERAAADEEIPGSRLPVPPKMPLKQYERELLALQIELVKAQSWIKAEGQKLLILVEGRDTAGKGGTITRFQEHLNPRGSRTVALAAPNDRERTQYYFQRYFEHLPAAGEMVFFDRSWYNRAGVERVMDFCTRAETSLFLRTAPSLEAGLKEAGIRFHKLYLVVNREEQLKRLDARRTDPLKSWKLSPLDLEAPKHWDDYTRAQNDMFLFTHTPQSPWTVVNSNDKRTARLNAIRFLLDQLDYTGKDPAVALPPDPAIVGPPTAMWPDLASLS
jgi:polyphosphate kinase 2